MLIAIVAVCVSMVMFLAMDVGAILLGPIRMAELMRMSVFVLMLVIILGHNGPRRLHNSEVCTTQHGNAGL
jgi:hypothetical protein